MKYSESNSPMVCMLTNSTCYRKTITMKPIGILWHSTGANNPYIKRYVQPSDTAKDRTELINKIGVNTYKNDWNHITLEAGVNAFIGKLANGEVTTVQTLPWDYRPWGCGSGKNGSCNNGFIQFEVCEDALNDSAYFKTAYNEACELTAYLCKLYNIDPNGSVMVNGVKVPTILCHQDSYKLGLGSDHSDVYHWFKRYNMKDMSKVRADVAALLTETTDSDVKDSTKKENQSTPKTTKFAVGDIVKITGKYYYSGGEAPSWVLAKNWIVYSVIGDRVVINKSEDGKSEIKSPFRATDLALVSKPTNKNTTTAATPSTDTIYVVKKGDILSVIASKHGTTVSKLVEYNGIKNPNILTVGQKIKIPAAKSTTTAKSATTTKSAAIRVGDTVKVKSGAKTYDGKTKLSSKVYKNTYKVTELVGKRAVIGSGKSTIAAVNVNDLIKA